MNYFRKIQKDYSRLGWNSSYHNQHFIREDEDPLLWQLPEDEGLSGYQVLIQTADPEKSNNVLTKDGLLQHVNLMQEIANIKIIKFGL